MKRPKGRVLKAGEMLRVGDMFDCGPFGWTQTREPGRPVTLGEGEREDYIRPEHLATPEPPPTDGEGPAIWDLVVEDMKERDAFGRDKYGKPLRAADGRKTLRDAYQEALDLAVYLRKAIYETEGR